MCWNSQFSSTIKCCKDCTKRHAACHSTCSDYKREKKAWDERKEKIEKSKNKDLMGYTKDKKLKHEAWARKHRFK